MKRWMSTFYFSYQCKANILYMNDDKVGYNLLIRKQSSTESVGLVSDPMGSIHQKSRDHYFT
jgi:hypothetical protein